MSLAKELLSASRSDAFRITEDTTPQQFRRLDLRLVQSFKRSGGTIEVRFADLAKLCEIADKAELAEREAALSRAGAERLGELMGVMETAMAEDDGMDEGGC